MMACLIICHLKCREKYKVANYISIFKEKRKEEEEKEKLIKFYSFLITVTYFVAQIDISSAIWSEAE